MKDLRTVLFPPRNYKKEGSPARPSVDENAFWLLAKKKLSAKQYVAFK
ncbi:unnamed protein product, partial [marine sediment metagenome]